MTNVQTMDDLTMPETQPFRVVGVGATYYAPVKTVGPDGKPTVVLSYRIAPRGSKIDLTADQAQRLQELGAAKPWDEPKSYDEMADDELANLARTRGIAVASSGADPAQPLRTDFLAAHASYDLGQDSAVLGAGTVPGGVTHIGAVLPADLGDGDSYSAQGRSATEVAQWISAERPNASDTVGAAGDDPATARVVLEAEQAATNGDPRKGVADQLQKIIDQGAE